METFLENHAALVVGCCALKRRAGCCRTRTKAGLLGDSHSEKSTLFKIIGNYYAPIRRIGSGKRLDEDIQGACFPDGDNGIFLGADEMGAKYKRVYGLGYADVSHKDAYLCHRGWVLTSRENQRHKEEVSVSAHQAWVGKGPSTPI